MFCSNCGGENPETANFCVKCGNQINQDPNIQPYQGQPPQQFQQQQHYKPDMKETFKHSAVSGAGTYAGCCCMNALSNLMCDACE